MNHEVFGPGTILDDDPVKQVWMVQFDDMATPRKLSFRAKLESLS